MSEIAEKLKGDLSRLDQKDRAALALFLLQSLDEGEDDDAEEAWDAELAKRGQEIESGQAVGIPWDEAMAALRAKHS